LSQAVRGNVTLPRNRFQVERDSECLATPSFDCKGNGDLRGIEWAVA
jgi:hypothetical protein